MSEPTTQAGRDLLARAILTIEREAREQAEQVKRLREAIDAAMDHIDNDETGPAFDVLRAALASTEEPRHE